MLLFCRMNHKTCQNLQPVNEAEWQSDAKCPAKAIIEHVLTGL